MKVTAKVKCNHRTQVDEDQDIVRFHADYADTEGREINAEWARYTPGIELSMTVRRSVPFEAGKAYTLTFDDGE